MVEDFMDIHMDESERFVIEPTCFDFADLVQESLFAVAPMAEERDARVQLADPVVDMRVVGDRQRLYRVCLNLLNNALKHSARGGTVTVCVKWAETDQSRRLLFSVADEGPGVPQQFQELIFEKFFRLDSGNVAGLRGVGLGLAFCRLVVEAHGGSIWVESPLFVDEARQSRGCRFAFAVPQPAGVASVPVADDGIHVEC